jgi:beta-N-acetylhexosaminidase
MVGFHGMEATESLRDLLLETGAFSVILFTRNLVDASQAKDLVEGIRSLVPWPLLIAIDQEGGCVVRLTKGVTVFPGNMALGAAGDPGLALAQGRESGRQLSAIGIDLNLAPVVDLQTNPRNPGIGIRSFGSHREAARELARSLIDGHIQEGVACCLKHFPGKGAASVDAHIDLPVLDLPIEEFRDPHIEIFKDLCEGREDIALMSTHIVVRGLDRENPATFSRSVMQGLLREDLGFRGLSIADDLEMGAIVKYHKIGQAALRAAEVGHDLVPICHSSEAQREAAKVLNRGLKEGILDQEEHQAACARIRSFAARSQGGVLVDPKEGNRLAAEVAERAVHLFSDSRGLLPIADDASLLVLATEPFSVVGVEEEADQDFAGMLRRVLANPRKGISEIRTFGAELDEARVNELLQEARGFDRVVLMTWNALGIPAQRFLLEELSRNLSDRLIVVHSRNPFDQVFVPDGVTALTAFGYRIGQFEAIAAVLQGRAKAKAPFPAEWK